MLGEKIMGRKKKLGLKKTWIWRMLGPKNFGSNKIDGPKMIGPKKYGYKEVWFYDILVHKIYNPQKIGSKDIANLDKGRQIYIAWTNVTMTVGIF